jgi:hypothetical protein
MGSSADIATRLRLPKADIADLPRRQLDEHPALGGVDTYLIHKTMAARVTTAR